MIRKEWGDAAVLCDRGGGGGTTIPSTWPLPAAILILFPPLIRTTVDNGWLNQGSSLQRSVKDMNI